MQKMKSLAIKGMQIHNQREKESQTNGDIDPKKLHLNYDLVNGDYDINYKEKIETRIQEGVTTGKTIRKDAVKLASFLVTSDKDFFDQLDPREEKRFFEESYEFLAEKYGRENIVYAMVHKDEKTPHMHVGFVPITEDGRLSAKEFFGGRQFLRDLQDEFHKHVKEKGFDLERGVSSDKKHIETARFKALTAHEKLQELEAEFKDGIEQLEILKKDIQEQKVIIDGQRVTTSMNQYHVKESEQKLETLKAQLREIESPLQEIDSIKAKTALGTVILKKDDFENLKGMAQKAILKDENSLAAQKENEKLREENKNLTKRMKQVENETQHTFQRIGELTRENEKLLKEKTKFEKLFNFTKLMFQQLGEKVWEQASALLDRKEKEFEKENDRGIDR